MTTQRPWPQRRRLQAGQLAELTIVNCKSGATTFIYETAELIEAHNWTSDGDCLIFNADGRIFRISSDGQRGPGRVAYLSYPPGTEGHPPNRAVELRIMKPNGEKMRSLVSC